MKAKPTAKKSSIQVKDLNTRKNPKGGTGLYLKYEDAVIGKTGCFPVGSSVGTTRK